MKSHRLTFRLLRLSFCVLLFGFATMQRGNTVFGLDLRREKKPETAPADAAPAVQAESGTLQTNILQAEPDGSIVLDSTALASDVRGYAGPVPVRVRIGPDGLVASVEPLPNAESPGFFKKLTREGLWQSWDGLTPAEAAEKPVDAVTGATFSSEAAIANVRAALRAMPDTASGTSETASDAVSETVPAAKVAAVAVLLAGALLPLVAHARIARTVRLALNVAVLGFWSGVFLSHARLIGWAGTGLPRDVWSLVGAGLLLVTAFLYPLLGRPGHYCAHLCPFGSLQELAGQVPTRKWRLAPGWVKGLNLARRTLWVTLLLALLLGRAGTALDWELFAAFAWRAVPPLVLALAAVFVALSVFVPRAYCRFVCPTGSLFKFVDSGR